MLYDFNVGDKVRIVMSNQDRLIGVKGKISKIHSCSLFDYDIAVVNIGITDVIISTKWLEHC